MGENNHWFFFTYNFLPNSMQNVNNYWVHIYLFICVCVMQWGGELCDKFSLFIPWAFLFFYQGCLRNWKRVCNSTESKRLKVLKSATENCSLGTKEILVLLCERMCILLVLKLLPWAPELICSRCSRHRNSSISTVGRNQCLDAVYETYEFQLGGIQLT